MFDDGEDFLPPREEEVPPRLAKKWEEREKREGLKECSACRKQILASSGFCPYCGKPMETGSRDWVYVTAGILLLMMIIFGVQALI